MGKEHIPLGRGASIYHSAMHQRPHSSLVVVFRLSACGTTCGCQQVCGAFREDNTHRLGQFKLPYLTLNRPPKEGGATQIQRFLKGVPQETLTRPAGQGQQRRGTRCPSIIGSCQVPNARHRPASGSAQVAAVVTGRRPTEMSRTWHDAYWARTLTAWRPSQPKGSSVTRLGLWGPIRAMPKHSPPATAFEDGLVYSLWDYRYTPQTQECPMGLRPLVMSRARCPWLGFETGTLPSIGLCLWPPICAHDGFSPRTSVATHP